MLKVWFFDSGSWAKHVLKSFESYSGVDFAWYLYCDYEHCPYGARESEEIYNLTKIGVEKLRDDFDCQVVILACNTASVHALRRLQNLYRGSGFYLLGITYPACESVRDHLYDHVTLFATDATIRSSVYPHYITSLSDQAVTVEWHALPWLVDAIESDNEAMIQDITDYALHKIAPHTQAVILGCSHYPIISNLFQEKIQIKYPDRKIAIIDPWVEAAKRFKIWCIHKKLI